MNYNITHDITRNGDFSVDYSSNISTMYNTYGYINNKKQKLETLDMNSQTTYINNATCAMAATDADDLNDAEILKYLTEDMGFTADDFEVVMQNKTAFKIACQSSNMGFTDAEFDRIYGIIEDYTNSSNNVTNSSDDYDRAMSIL